MNFRESFNNLFHSRSPENTAQQADDLTDYTFLFSTFEERLEKVKPSLVELATLLSDFKATFFETGVGKEYRHLTEEKNSLMLSLDTSDETTINMGAINMIDQKMMVIENSDEFVGYKDMVERMEKILHDGQEELPRVA